MKKITKLWIGTLAFVFLFYNQDMGVNVALIALLIWLLLSAKPINTGQKKRFWLLSACTFITAVSFAWYGDAFSFFALVLSLLVLGLQSQYPRINIVLYPFLWFINYATFIFRFFSFKYWLPKRISGNDFFKKMLAFVLIPGFIVLVFTLIYTSGSDIFYSFFQNIPFDFNFFQIVFLGCLGFFLFFNLWFVFIPKMMIKLNGQLGADFTAGKQVQLQPTFSFLEINFERKSGEISLILLNILLMFFIVTYNYEQFFSTAGKAILSSEVHQRVAVIIFSIVLAIGVIMFYFKSTFNFDEKASLLKKLTYLWIILNSLLIISAFIKNTEYVSALGLTYKRIGVYIFLCLSLTGLFITYFKIHYRKTNVFLMNRMAAIFFFTFIITSCINFSWIVTKYNIAFQKTGDVEYLRSLEFNKQILFNAYKNNPDWQPYFENRKEWIKQERAKSFLSSHIYFWSLQLENKTDAVTSINNDALQMLSGKNCLAFVCRFRDNKITEHWGFNEESEMAKAMMEMQNKMNGADKMKK